MNRAAVTAIDEARVVKALTLLGAARRERLDKADYEAFVDGLSAFPVVLVERVCRDFAAIAPPEYGPRFPALHSLREACFKVQDREREKRLALKARPEEPISQEKFNQLLTDIRQAIGRKSL